jgi:hypothetical protein
MSRLLCSQPKQISLPLYFSGLLTVIVLLFLELLTLYGAIEWLDLPTFLTGAR